MQDLTVPTSPRRQLGLISVSLITFFSVCGGPFGSEPIISSCGPFVGILALVLFPLIYSMPMNLILAELCSAFPVDGSFCTWVELAFGTAWGFYVGYWSWMASTFDAAVYPCLVSDTIFIDLDVSWSTKTATRLVILTLFMFPTLFSMNFIGKTSTWLALLVLMPFVVLIVLAIPQATPELLLSTAPSMQWSKLFSVLFWNFRGFDAIGAYAGEIKNPQKNFHGAMILSLTLITFTYMLPLVASAAVNKPPYITWVDGSFPTIATAIGGQWLGIWVACSNTISSFGLYFAESSANGFRLAGMADKGLVPSWFAIRHPTTGSPRRCIGFIYGISVVMCCFDFTTILGITNALSILAQLIQCVAAITLRYTAPALHRPYKVALSNCTLVAALIVPIALAICIFVSQVLLNNATLALTGAAVLLGIILNLGHEASKGGYEAIEKCNI